VYKLETEQDWATNNKLCEASVTGSYVGHSSVECVMETEEETCWDSVFSKTRERHDTFKTSSGSKSVQELN
jgi:hypothetical protein